MLSQSLELPISLLLGLSLGVFISQRKFQEQGLEKRKATLIISALIAILWFSVVYINKSLVFKLDYAADKFLIYPVLLVLVLLLVFKKRIFVFKIRCRVCSNKIDFKKYLYSDKNICINCEESFGLTVEDVNWDLWNPEERAVLCIVRKENEVLLIHKKTGLGAGLINFPGGRIEKGETPKEASIRETKEEVGLDVENLKEIGLLSFVFKDGYSLSAHVFITDDFSGTEIETDEADPFWCKINSIPYDKMWEDDILWVPEVLNGKYIKAFFVFDEDKMTSQKVIIE